VSGGRAHTIGVEMHGATLNLHCEHEPQLRFTEAVLGPMVRDPWERPHLEVEGIWLTPGSTEGLGAPVFDLTGLDAYGKHMHIGEDRLVWTSTHRDKYLQLRFRRSGGVPCFDVAYQYVPSARRLSKHPDFECKKYSELVRYLVLFPFAWYLRRTRGWELLHAAAAMDGERAVVFAGPSGAGKSTTCVALMAIAGMPLLTENLALTDGVRIHPISEPIRLTDECLELVGEAGELLQPFPSGGLKNKSMFLPPPESAGAPAEALFLVRLCERGFVRRLPPPQAYRAMRATNVLSQTLDDFTWFAAALELLWPYSRPRDGESLMRLTRREPCFSLGIDRASGTRALVERILECLRGGGAPIRERATS
jgi:hypothetical protein